MFFKIDVLENFALFTGKHLCRSLFLIKLHPRPATLLIKRDSTQVFCCKYCEVLKNSFFCRAPPVATFPFPLFPFLEDLVQYFALFYHHCLWLIFEIWSDLFFLLITVSTADDELRPKHTMKLLIVRSAETTFSKTPRYCFLSRRLCLAFFFTIYCN